MLKLATDSVITDIQNLGLFERLASMVVPMVKQEEVGRNEQTDRPILKEQVFPISSNLVAGANCWEGGRYKALLPNSTVRAMGYFEVVQPLRKSSTAFKDVNKRLYSVMEGRVMFVAIVNIPKMNLGGTYSDNSEIAPDIIGTVMNLLDRKQVNITSPNFQNSIARFNFAGNVDRDIKKVFGKYNFYEDGLNIHALGLYPNDFGACLFDVAMLIPKACFQSAVVGTPVDCKIL